MTLKNSAAGADDIHPVLLEKHASLLTAPLAEFVNDDLDGGDFSSSLKLSKACILFKTGDRCRCRPDNYRLISLASAPSKVIETYLKNSVTDFLLKANYLQYGFLPKSDTANAANGLVTSIQNTLNRKRLAAVIYIAKFTLYKRLLIA